MAGKHKGWHKKWVVDLAAHCATHESGAIVDFVCGGEIPPGGTFDNPDLARPQIGCVSLPPDGAVWVGSFRGGEAAAASWLSGNRFDPSSLGAAQRLRRIMREAGDAYAWEVRKHNATNA